MASLKEIRRRISGVQKTRQMTRAMKMVAATKLRRYQDALLKMRPYAEHLEFMIDALLHNEQMPPNPLLEETRAESLTLMVMGGDRGLCGNFNSNIIKRSDRLIRSHPFPMQIIAFGKKVIDHYQRKNMPIDEEYVDLDDLDLLETSRSIADRVIENYITGTCGRFVIVYSLFHNVMTQEVLADQILPLVFQPGFTGKDPGSLEFLFYPDAETVLDELVPRYITWQIHRIMLESMASLYGARMTAMDLATRNAGDMIGELTQEYNRERQSAITTELIEIMSGADALRR